MNATKIIIIIGGGIGGLCTAIALQQNGLEVTLYEKVGRSTIRFYAPYEIFW
jgi:2-polyprenyl-6-methoxyphenol hydroxylase-like FAD-dependent oxidoreductase